MGFMVPVAEYFTKSDLVQTDHNPFTCHECREEKHSANICASGESYTVCADCWPPEEGWYARLSAPGYLDASDWHGPFNTQENALYEIMEFYEVDQNGDDLPEE